MFNFAYRWRGRGSPTIGARPENTHDSQQRGSAWGLGEGLRQSRIEGLQRIEVGTEALEAEKQQISRLQHELKRSNEFLQHCKKERDRFEQSLIVTNAKCAEQELRIIALEAGEIERTAQVEDILLTADKQVDKIANLGSTITQKDYHIGQLNLRIKRHVGENEELSEIIAQHRLTITELTGTILSTTNSVGTATRDDDYFQGEFASLAGAIHQWVFRYFRNGPDIWNRDLSLAVHQSLKATNLGYEPMAEKKINLKELEAAVTEKLVNHVFYSNFIFKINKELYPTIASTLGGTILEKRTWHAQTVNLVLQNQNFDACFRKGVNTIAEDLKGCFIGFAKPGSQESCYKTLQAFVEHAAKLEVEICRQVSSFELVKVVPGSGYISATMEDISGSADDDEDADSNGGFVVQVVHFPPILRWELNSEGDHSKMIIIRKGAVFAVESEEGWESE